MSGAVAVQPPCTHAGASSLVLGREPIFDAQKNVYGYQVSCPASNPAAISTEILELLCPRKPVFINVQRAALLGESFHIWRRENVVIELVDAGEPDSELIIACKNLKSTGVMLALNGAAFGEQHRPLLDLADVLKIDFLTVDEPTRKRISETFGGKSLKLLADKVQSHADFHQALDLGYSYVQGYFFCKPQAGEKKDLPASRQAYMRFVQEVNAETLNFDRIEEVIKSNISLSSKLLRLLNSASMGMGNRITSIKQALSLLGEKPLRRWATLVALQSLGDEKPTELMVTALVRARFCELLGNATGLKERDLDLFLMGLFSTLDALLDQPMSQLLSKTPVAGDVAAALLGANGTLGRIYSLVLSIERGRASRVEHIAAQLGVNVQSICEAYRQAATWADRNTET